MLVQFNLESSVKFDDVLTKTKKKKKKMAKIQELKFYNSLDNFGIYPPKKYAWFFLEWICRVLSEEMSFEIFTHIWFHVYGAPKGTWWKKIFGNFLRAHVIPSTCARNNFTCSRNNFTCARNNYYVLT